MKINIYFYKQIILQTHLALEALLVPLAVQRGNGLFGDGLLATAALGRVQPLVVGRAVRFAVPFEEGLPGELLLARPAADKVLQVPGLAHRFDHFLLGGNLKKKEILGF